MTWGRTRRKMNGGKAAKAGRVTTAKPEPPAAVDAELLTRPPDPPPAERKAGVEVGLSGPMAPWTF